MMGMFGGGFNKPGGWADKLGGISDLLTGNSYFAQRNAKQNDLQQQMELARFKASLPQQAPEDPSIIRTLQAAGIDPSSPEGRDIIKNNLNRPIFPTGPNGEVYGMGGAYGTPGIAPAGVGGNPTTKTVNGVTYHFVNGAWYDNPEGR